MSKSYVIIERPDKMAIYVVVLTKESTATFWNDLSREIVGLHKPNTKVYFDYFFRNGLDNRVFSSHTDENGVCSLTAIEPIIDDPNFDINVFNGFHKLYDNKLSEDVTLDVKMKSSPKTENTDNQYEEISKQLTEIQLYIDSLNEKVNTLITILTEKQNLASKCLSTNV